MCNHFATAPFFYWNIPLEDYPTCVFIGSVGKLQNLASLENYCIPRLRRDLLLRSKVNTLKPRFAREKGEAAF